MKNNPNLRLKPQQLKFVDEYMKDLNGRQAAIRAGYSVKGSNRQSYALLRKPHVMKVIRERMQERKDKSDIDPTFVLNKIAITIQKAENQDKFNEVLRGCELLGRHLGMFVDRTEITGKDGEAIQYEKIAEDADAFTRTVTSLAARGRALKAVGESDS